MRKSVAGMILEEQRIIPTLISAYEREDYSPEYEDLVYFLENRGYRVEEVRGRLVITSPEGMKYRSYVPRTRIWCRQPRRERSVIARILDSFEEAYKDEKCTYTPPEYPASDKLKDLVENVLTSIACGRK